MERLQLRTPAFDELWYRQRMLADAATMSYNRGYDLSFDGYDRETGCIAFGPEQWREWYDRWIGREPDRFYAYIVRRSDGALIGEVCLRRHETEGWHEMGIVVEARHRGQGYAAEALRLLLDHAFYKLGAEAVHNHFEQERAAALRIHLNAGFQVICRENGLLGLLLTRAHYL